MEYTDWFPIHTHILELEQRGIISRTFRRLDPNRQKTIINAILEQAIEQGPAAFNIKLVAKRAGVSIGSLYTYFPNREGVQDFVIELCTYFTCESLKTYTPALIALPLPEALHAYIQGGLEWSSLQTTFIQFLARAAYTGDPNLSERLVRPVAETMLQITRQLLQAAQQRGEIAPHADLEACARAVNALLITLGDSQILPYLNTYFQVSDQQVTFERVCTAAIHLVTAGLNFPSKAGEQ
ncbi:MAG TPA: TetR/AcrR family transcriptional regulator [Anaerolineaceae bacterium]